MSEIVAVTGASGHIGGNLVRALLNQGRRVRVLEHLHHGGYDGLDVEIIKGDVCDINSLNKLFSGVNIAYHLAAKIYLGKKRNIETENVNIAGTKNVATACLNNKVRRLIHFSSVHALSPFPLNETVNEERSFISDPQAACYDLTKAAGEQEIQKAVKLGLNAVILNPCGVIGPNDFGPSAMGKLLLDMNQKRFFIICQGGFNWVDVRDVVDAAIASETKGRRGERYLLSGEWVAISEMANIISQKRSFCCTLPFRAAHIMAHFSEIYGDWTKTHPRFTTAAVTTLQHYRFINNEKAKKELGYSPRPIKETLFDTLNWLKAK